MGAEATIRVNSETKGMLDGLRVHPRESCSDVIGRLARRCCYPDPLSDEEIAGLEEALEDIEAGRTISGGEIRWEYGIEGPGTGSTTRRGPRRTWRSSRDQTPRAWSGCWRGSGTLLASTSRSSRHRSPDPAAYTIKPYFVCIPSLRTHTQQSECPGTMRVQSRYHRQQAAPRAGIVSPRRWR